MRAHLRFLYFLLLAIAFAGPALAQTDPSLNQVYDAVRAGHIEQAQNMMKQVLRDHPKSGKAHYVAAEVDAAAGNITQARHELRTAEELAPGLPFASAESVRELRDKLSRTSLPRTNFGHARPPASGVPWGLLAVIVIGVGVVVGVVLMRRRAPSNLYSMPSPTTMPPPGAGYGATAAPPAGMPPSPGGSGIGSSVAGGLAGGLAAGAGIVAGEEIARHLMGSGEREASPPPAEPVPERRADDDYGGNDFGVSDPGSWDDDQQDPGGGGGGDDNSWN